MRTEAASARRAGMEAVLPSPRAPGVSLRIAPILDPGSGVYIHSPLSALSDGAPHETESGETHECEHVANHHFKRECSHQKLCTYDGEGMSDSNRKFDYR